MRVCPRFGGRRTWALSLPWFSSVGVMPTIIWMIAIPSYYRLCGVHCDDMLVECPLIRCWLFPRNKTTRYQPPSQYLDDLAILRIPCSFWWLQSTRWRPRYRACYWVVSGQQFTVKDKGKHSFLRLFHSTDHTFFVGSSRWTFILAKIPKLTKGGKNPAIVLSYTIDIDKNVSIEVERLLTIMPTDVNMLQQ